MDGPVGIAKPPSTWTLETAYQYATARAIPPADPDGEPLYNCPFPPCSKQFSKRFNLKAHLRVHTGDKPFACPYPGCSRRFMWKSSLTSHQAGHNRRKAELAKRNAALPHDLPHHRYPQWGAPQQQHIPHLPQQPQNHYFQHHQTPQQQQQQQHPQQQHHQQLPFSSQPVSSSPMSYISVEDPNPQPHLVAASQPLSQPLSVSQPTHLHSSPFPTHSSYNPINDRQLPVVQQTHTPQQHQHQHQQYHPNSVEERHRQRQQLLQEQQRELQRQQHQLREQARILNQQQLQHEEEQRRIEQLKAHQEQPMLDPSKSAIRQSAHQIPPSSLGLPQQQVPPPSYRPPPAHPQRPPVPPVSNHSAQQLPSNAHRSMSHPHRAQPQHQEQVLQKQPSAVIDRKQEQVVAPKQEDIPQQMSSRPPTSPAPPTPGRDLARLMKKDALAQPGKPSSSMLGHSSTHSMSATTSLLPSPSASLGMPRSPNAFSQQFLFPSQASSPTWATTPNVPTPSGPGPSPMAVSPKPPTTPNNQMDVQMGNGDHHAGDISPLPAELPASPSVTSPVPPPILPEVSNNRTRRVPNRSARPPLGGPSLSSGPSALLPPLANVAPANPPTYINLGGLGMDDEPSLPALGSPHTELSPLPVASPIFGTAQTPTSPMQPFSPFSGMNASSVRTKPASTW